MADTRTPSAILSAAADLVRDTAAAASQGQWAEPYWDDNPGDRGWWILNGQQGMREYAVAATFALNPKGEQDARWIALLSPAVSGPLAELLKQSTGMWRLWESRPLTRRAIEMKVGAAAVAALGLAEKLTGVRAVVGVEETLPGGEDTNDGQ